MTGSDDKKLRSLIVLAADGSEAAYKREKQTHAAGITKDAGSYEILKEISATHDGSIKATMIRVDPVSKTLVIAVRGTTTAPIDWVNDANGDPVEAGLVGLDVSTNNFAFQESELR